LRMSTQKYRNEPKKAEINTHETNTQKADARPSTIRTAART